MKRGFNLKHNIPNLLGFIRIISAPFIVVFVALEQNYIAAAILLFAGLTDFLDGYLARKWDAITDYGITEDKIADAVLAGSAIIALFILLPEVMLKHFLWILICIGCLSLIGFAIKRLGHKHSDLTLWSGKASFSFFCVAAFIVLITLRGGILIPLALTLEVLAHVEKYYILRFHDNVSDKTMSMFKIITHDEQN